MTAINFLEIPLFPNDLIRVYTKAEQNALQGTFLLKSDRTIFCNSLNGLLEIPLKEVERIVVLSQSRDNILKEELL